MKKIKLTILLFLLAGVLNAQDLETILKKHYDASGSEKLSKVETIYMEMEMVMMGTTVPAKSYIKRPKMIRTEISMMGQEVIQGSDGTDFWMINPASGQVTDLPEAAKSQLSEQGDLDGALWNYKEKGNEVKYAGIEEKKGKKYYKLNVVIKKMSDQKVDFYIDTDNYMLVYQDVHTPMGMAENHIEEYITKDGMKIPGKFVTSVGGAVQLTATVKKLELGQKFEDSLFKRPSK